MKITTVGHHVHRLLGQIAMRGLVVGSLAVSMATQGQSLDERLDEERFLRGLSDLQLPEVLEQYIRTHPPTGPVDEARYEIAALQIQMQQRHTTPVERRGFLESIIAIRRQLIDDHPVDPRYARWLTDQAWDLVFELPALDGTLLAAVYGLPSPAQDRLAQRISRESNVLTDEAELAIEQAIIDFEGQPGYTSDPALQAARRRLDRDERRQRIPLLRGISAYLHARFNVADESTKAELCRVALDRLSPLVDQLEGIMATQGTLYAGLAALELRRTDEARAWFQRVIDEPVASPAEKYAANIGLNMVIESQSGVRDALRHLSDLEKQYTSPRDVIFRLLLTDRRFLLRVQLANRGAPANRMRDMAVAYRTYTNLLRKDLGIPKDTVRQIVYARLATAGGEDTPIEELPAIVAIARAERLRSEAGDRQQIVAMLQAVLDRSDADDDDRGEALYGLGVTLYENGDSMRAAQRFTQLCDQYSAHNRAERSMELAVTITAEYARDNAGSKDARTALATALNLAIERYPTLPDIERWRYLAGRMALVDDRLDVARQRFEAIPPDADEWIDAQLMLGTVTRDLTWAEPDPQVRSEQLRALTEHMRNLITRIDQHLQASDVPSTLRDKAINHKAALAVIAAEAWIELSNPQEAVRMIETIEADPVLDAATTAELLRTRILAYQAAGRSSEAAGEIKRFLRTAPERATSVFSAMIEQLLSSLRAQQRRSGSRQVTRILEQLLQLTEPVDRWLSQSSSADGDTFRLRFALAESYRECGQHGPALRLYGQLDDERTDSLEVLFGRAECLFLMTAAPPDEAALADAMRAYKRISASRAPKRDSYYWQSELRMLQILDRLGRNTHRIAPRIQGLRQKDDDLGGSALRRQFDELLRKYS